MSGQVTNSKPGAAFAARLREAQADAGLSNRELAQRLDISESLLGKWRRGDNHPTFGNIVLLAGILEKPLDFFVPRDEVAA